MKIFKKNLDPQSIRSLIFSAMDGDEQYVTKLLSDGVPVDSIWSNDGLEEGSTALMMAAWKGHEGIVELLIQKGANIRAKTQKGSTVLDYAVLSESIQIVSRILEAGARLDTSKALRGAAIGDLFPPHDASWADIMKLLLTAGADPNHTDDEGTTPLMTAAANGHTEAVKLLLLAGADVAVRNQHGKSANDFAIERDHRDIITLLSQRT